MARKVDLDLLEIEDPPAPDEPETGEVPEKREGGAVLQLAKRKWLVVSVSLFALSCVVGVAVWMNAGPKEVRVDREVVSHEAKAPPPVYVEYLDGFTVDLKDDRGNYRVLVCDIALELKPDLKIPADKSEMRKRVYYTLKNSGKYVLETSSGYKTLKKNIEDELDKIIGGEVTVYFTRFLLL